MAQQFRFDVTFDVKEVSGMLIATGREFAMWFAARDQEQLRRVVTEGVEEWREHLSEMSDDDVEARLVESGVRYERIPSTDSPPPSIRLPVVVGG